MRSASACTASTPRLFECGTVDVTLLLEPLASFGQPLHRLERAVQAGA
jgi:hypothetical protein